MRKFFNLLGYFTIGLLCFFSGFSNTVGAVGEVKTSASPKLNPSSSSIILLDEPVEATLDADASEEASFSSILEKVVEKKPDITTPTPQVKGQLERYLAEHPLKTLSVTNFLQHAIRGAIKNGVPANTIVLILLFPLVAALIAASRHIIGIRGFGIFLPAVLSVAMVATGIFEGVLLFLMIIFVATGSRILLRKMKLEYLPRMALLLWFVCLGVLASLFLSPILYLKSIMTLSIFPILILILLAESFIGIQIGKSMKEAMTMTFETLLIALVCSFVLQLEFLQKFALLYPELFVIGVLLLDIFMGKYVGLRLIEYKKFKSLMK